MKQTPARRRLATLAIVPLLVAGMSLFAGPPAASAATPKFVKAACGTLTAAELNAEMPSARCYAMGAADTSGKLAVRSAAAGPPSTALGPPEIQSAYQLPDAGAGMTVAIVDAFGYDSAEADLAVFRSHYGLAPCTTANGCFKKVDQRGGTDYPEQDGGWSVETALDLDAVSSACPRCDILLVQGDTNDMGDLGESVNTAARLGAVAVSNSYGIDGELPGEQSFDAYYDHPGIAVTVSSGDHGNVQSYPATSPVVTSVGGTRLTADDSARGWAETAWDEAGSGCSVFEPKPDFQAGVDTKCDNRASADIGADADPASGLAVYNTLGQSGWAQWGGTSLASPLVAAMYALAGQATPGTYPVTYPYQNRAKLFDVTAGTNGSCGDLLCQAGPGWDGPTGFGSPVGITALTLGDTGEVAGKVTDAGSGSAIAGVTVTATRANGDRFSATSGADGTYDLHAPADTYNLTATKFGYGDQAATGITLTAGATAPKDFALTAKPSRTISGHVTDGSGHGWPMRAKITIDGVPNGVAYSEPYTGNYSVSLPTGASYKLHVASADLPGYTGQDLTVALAGRDVQQDVALKVDQTSCSAPGYAFHEDGTSQAFTGWRNKTPQNGWTITDAVGNGQTWGFDSPGGWEPPPGGDADFAVVDSDAYGENGRQDTALVSPVLDLTGQDDPEVGFDTTFIGFPDQAGSVDLSLDGGQTWSSVRPMSGGVIDHLDIPIPQAAGHGNVRVRFQYTGSWSRRWEIDNVIIGARYCAPQTGGLVAGTVTDANTGAPLNGATIASDVHATEFGVSAATPDDANLDDGYYWVFSSQTGKTPFTVTNGRYAVQHPTVTVPANSIRQADLELDAGHLTVDQSQIALDEALGASKSATVTFGNDGRQAVQVHLGETDGGVTPAAGRGAPASVVKTPTSITAMGTAGTGAPAVRQPTPAAAPWTDVADFPTTVMDNAVAEHDGKVYSVGGNTGAAKLDVAGSFDPAENGWRQLPSLPEAMSAASAAFVGDTLYVVGGWDQLSNASTKVYTLVPGATSWDRAADLPSGAAAAGIAVVAGKLYVIGGCTTSQCAPVSAKVYSYDQGGNSWAREPDYPVAVAYIACGGVAASVVCAGGNAGGGITKTYAYLPGSGGWTAKADLPVDAWGAAAASANGRLQVMGGAINAGAGITNQAFSYDLNTNTWSALPNSNNATYRGGAACGIYKVGGSAGGFNAVSFVENLPGYGDCGGDVGWMSENKTDFSVAPGRTVTVRVTADSSMVSQPGAYQGLLSVSTDSPYSSAGPVKVAMTVTPPAAWGKISGTVTGSGGAPLAGATVAVCTMYDTKTGACGPTKYTLKTDGAGNYQLWLNKGFNPLQVIAAKDGYTPAMKIVRIQKGEAVTTDFALTGDSAFTPAKVQQYLNGAMHAK